MGLGLQPGGGEVVLEHLADHFREADFGTPAETYPGLAGIAAEVGDLGRTEVGLIDLDIVLPLEPDESEGEFNQLPDAPLHTGGDHIVVRLLLLEHQPHGLDIVFGVTPVTLGIEVAEPEF